MAHIVKVEDNRAVHESGAEYRSRKLSEMFEISGLLLPEINGMTEASNETSKICILMGS
jgi:hypothetical protein